MAQIEFLNSFLVVASVVYVVDIIERLSLTFAANGKMKFPFAKTRRNFIYLSSFVVCYPDISSNFSKE